LTRSIVCSSREVPGSTAAAALVAVSVVDIRITPSLRS
jgi:hypothetical protein